MTREDFLKVRDLEIPERRKSLALTRDLFLFACYTGTAYADTVSITEENLFRDEEGNVRNRVAAYEDSIRHHHEMVEMAAYKDSIANKLLQELNRIKRAIKSSK